MSKSVTNPQHNGSKTALIAQRPCGTHAKAVWKQGDKRVVVMNGSRLTLLRDGGQWWVVRVDRV